jgi:hypothetical protein
LALREVLWPGRCSKNMKNEMNERMPQSMAAQRSREKPWLSIINHASMFSGCAPAKIPIV